MIREYSKEIKSITLLDIDGNEVFINDPIKNISSIKAIGEKSIVSRENGNRHVIDHPLKDLVKFIYG